MWAQGVTFDRLLHADKEPQNWLTYSGTVDGQRYSPLTQITPGQRQESGACSGSGRPRSTEKFETTALVVDGVLYTIQAPNDVYALDAVTGRIFWTLNYTPAPEARACCGRVNRGLAILGDTLYMGTLGRAPPRHRRQNRQDHLEHDCRVAAQRGALRHHPRAADRQG